MKAMSYSMSIYPIMEWHWQGLTEYTGCELVCYVPMLSIHHTIVLLSPILSMKIIPHLSSLYIIIELTNYNVCRYKAMLEAFFHDQTYPVPSSTPQCLVVQCTAHQLRSDKSQTSSDLKVLKGSNLHKCIIEPWGGHSNTRICQHRPQTQPVSRAGKKIFKNFNLTPSRVASW
jgi:hypothetical protein